MKKTSCSILLVITLALPGLAAAQREPAGEFGDLVEVTEIFLDVLATDKKGNTVLGLGKDDFLVKENGKPVEITSASFYTTRYSGDEPSASVAGDRAGEIAPEVPSSRYFILFFHDQSKNSNASNRLLRQQTEATRKAHDWIRDDLSGSDWVAVTSYDVKLIVHQDFTQDLASILAAIDDARIARDRGIERPSQLRRQTAGNAPSLLRGLPQQVDLAKETKRIYDAIRLLAEASRSIVGRKNLMLFTIGFGDVDFSLRTTRPDQRFYPAMEQTLNDNNMAVYPIDLTPPEFEHIQSDFLSQLAHDTGGYYHRNVVNFGIPLKRISEENQGYYLLSFRTEHPAGESGYREVKVKAKSGKIRVRTRRGYRYGVGG